MFVESHSIPSYSYLPNQLHSKVRNVLFPNDTWEELENDRIIKFHKYEQDEKIKRSDKKDANGKFFVCNNLKNLLRYGIPCQLRAKYWLLVSGGQNIIDNGFSYYEDMKEKVISENFLQQSNNPFGVPVEYLENFCNFNEDIITFIQVIYYHNQKTVEYAPFIPRVCFILLTFLKDHNSAYATIQSLINNNHDGWYFETTVDEFMISSIVIQNLCHSKVPKVFQHCQSLKVDMMELFLMFVFGKGYLSTSVTLTFFDSYINEGKKVFYRFFLTFLNQETKSILQSNTPEELKQCFVNFNQIIDDDANIFIEFIKKSFSLPLSRSRIIFKSDKKSHQKNANTTSSLPDYPIPINDNKPHDFNGFSINLAPLFDIEINDESSYENDSTNESYSQNNKNAESSEHCTKTPSLSKSELNRVDRLKTAELRRHSFIHTYSSFVRHINDNLIEKNQSSPDHVSNTYHIEKISNNGEDRSDNNHHHHHHHKRKRNINHQNDNIIQNEPPKSEPEILPNKILPTNSILSDTEFSIIRSFMPLFYRLSNPIRTYKLSQDGASFYSFQCGVTSNCPYLLVIRTKSRTVGAFLSDPPTNKATTNYSASIGGSSDRYIVGHSSYTSLSSFQDYHSSYSSKMINNVRRPGQYFGRMTTFVFSIKHKKKNVDQNEIDDSNATDINGNPSKVSVFQSVANCAYNRNNSNISTSSEIEEKSDKNNHKKTFLRSLIKRRNKHHRHHHHHHNQPDNDNSNSSTYNDSNHSHTSTNLNSSNSNANDFNNNSKSITYSNSAQNSDIIIDSGNDCQLNSKNDDTVLNDNSDDEDNSDGYKPTLFSDSNNPNDENNYSPQLIVYKEKNENSTSSTLSETNDDNKDSEEYYYKKSFISVFQDSISIGGPGPAIFMQEYLTKLYSYESKTFNSPSLTDHKNGDLINDVELYMLKKI